MARIAAASLALPPSWAGSAFLKGVGLDPQKFEESIWGRSVAAQDHHIPKVSLQLFYAVTLDRLATKHALQTGRRLKLEAWKLRMLDSGEEKLLVWERTSCSCGCTCHGGLIIRLAHTNGRCCTAKLCCSASPTIVLIMYSVCPETSVCGRAWGMETLAEHHRRRRSVSPCRETRTNSGK